MSGRERSTAWQWQGLDPYSQRVARWFVVRVYALAGFSLLPCLTSTQSLQDAAGLMSFACACGAMISTAFARLRREPFAVGSLNGWDEAMGFIAASRLAHMTQILLA